MGARVLIEVIETLAPLEWGRFGPYEEIGQNDFPPFAVWRFRRQSHDDDRVTRLEAALVEAVNGYRGAVEWSMVRHGRNWVLSPRLCADLFATGRFPTDSELHRYLADAHPEFGTLANKDASILAEHLRSTVRLVT